MKNLENCQEIVFGRTVSEIPPNPPLKKGAGRRLDSTRGISGRAMVHGKILAVGCGAPNLRTDFEKVINHVFFEQNL